jgi:hypothetical protein
MLSEIDLDLFYNSQNKTNLNVITKESFENLPLQALRVIFDNLSESQKQEFSSVCKNWYQFIYHQKHANEPLLQKINRISTFFWSNGGVVETVIAGLSWCLLPIISKMSFAAELASKSQKVIDAERKGWHIIPHYKRFYVSVCNSKEATEIDLGISIFSGKVFALMFILFSANSLYRALTKCDIEAKKNKPRLLFNAADDYLKNLEHVPLKYDSGNTRYCPYMPQPVNVPDPDLYGNFRFKTVWK